MPAHNSLWTNTLLTALLLGLGESGAIAQPLQPETLIAQSSLFQSIDEPINNPYSSSVDPDPGAVSSAAGYTLIHVNPTAGDNGTGDGSQLRPFQTITQALRSAEPNSIVLLAPGVYSIATGELFPLLLKPGVTVQGNPAGGDRSILIQGGGFFQSPSALERRNATILAADRAGLANVIVNNPTPGGHGLWIEAGSPIIRESQFVGSRNAGIVVAGRGAPIIQDNYFHQNRLAGLMITGPSQADVHGNLFEATGVGITVAEGATPRIIDNRIVYNQDGLVIYGNAQPELAANQISQNRRNRIVEFGAPAAAAALNASGERPTAENSAGADVSPANQATEISSVRDISPVNQGTATNQEAPSAHQTSDTVEQTVVAVNQDIALHHQDSTAANQAPPPATAPNAVIMASQENSPDPTASSTEASALALKPINTEATQNEESSETDEPIVGVNETPVEAEAAEVEIAAEESAEVEAIASEAAIISAEENIEAETAIAIAAAESPEADGIAVDEEEATEERATALASAPSANRSELSAPSELPNFTPDNPSPSAERAAPEQTAAAPPSVVLPAQILPSTSSPEAPPTENSSPALNPAIPTESEAADKRTDSPRFSALLTRLGVTNLINRRSSQPSPEPGQSEAIEIPVIGPPGHQTEPPLAIGSATSDTESIPSAAAIEIPVIPPPDSGADLSPLPEIPGNTAAVPSAPGRLQVPSSDIPIGSSGGLPTISVSRATTAYLEGPPAPPSRASTLGLYYRVIVVAEDESTQEQVRSLVPDAFRTQFDGQIVMQAGAYEDQATAEEQANMLIRNGFEAEVEFIR